MTSGKDHSSVSFPLLPGSWLGMLGGGQLGRMFCHAAQRLGYRVAVLDPAQDSPAGTIADLHIRAAYDDAQGIRQLAERCPAVTTEFENVPASTLEQLAAAGAVVSPGADAVAIVQDRTREKAFIRSAGVPVAPYTPVFEKNDIAIAAQSLFPGILKAARLGYDGKGQVRVATREQALQAWDELKVDACVLEALAPLAYEISVVVARGRDGEMVTYDASRNEHRDGILAVSTVSSDSLEPGMQERASRLAKELARELDYCGVMCVEFFVLTDGSLLVNEIAPRPHNSGHHTIDACGSSQFDQQVRTMAGMPLGSTQLLRPSIMLNLLGDLWFDGGVQREPDWAGVVRVPQAHLHLYGKTQPRHGRKMGHVTITGDTLAQAQERAAQVAGALGLAYQP